MGFLYPLFLAAAVAVAVPLVLHFLHRHQAPRIPFPAVRYLRRAEERHAFRIRLRQLLLLALRLAALLLLVTAGARPYLAGRGAAHQPTAVAIVLDNSMSTGVIEGDARLFDALIALALASADAAGPADRVWVLRAAQPWDPAVPGGGAEARARIRATEVTATRADLDAQLARALDLVQAAGLPGAEVHFLSDFQRTALPDRPPRREVGVPVMAYLPPGSPPRNRAVTDVIVASGLLPRANERSHLAATITVFGSAAAESVMVRLAIQDQVRAAQFAPAAASVVLPLPPLPAGTVDGSVEIDADGLRADDRRFFAARVRPPPRVATAGAPGPFLDEALAVLAEAGQLASASPASADVVFATGDLDPGQMGAASAIIVIPPEDATRLPALNRGLLQVAIPWRYDAAPAGSARISTGSSPEELRGIDVFQYYRLESTAPGVAAGEPLARLTNGVPWLVEGTADRAAFLLLASPLVPEASALPTSARMVPLVDWMANRWAARGTLPTTIETGQPVPVPSGATAIVAPDGTPHPLDGTELPRAAPAAGIYRVLQGDSVRALVAANAPPAESDLRRLTEQELSERLGTAGSVVTDSARWRRAIYARRRQLELWRVLIAASALLLAAELLAAAAGRRAEPSARTPSAGELT
ncbi:MAG: BatA domain-containing protein [Gemmatimonadetes bacterium]|nr:BatA domain-containing protein [Gemmatimonadota bacterium]